jgi:tRNA (guanine37-N1)-methyltransferase
MFAGPLTESIIKRASQAGLISIELHNIRDYAIDRHRTADDAPYGGGAGMVMKAEPLAAAIRSVTQRVPGGPSPRGYPVVSRQTSEPNDDGELSQTKEQHLEGTRTDDGQRTLVVLMSPAGERFTQHVAQELAGYDRLVLVCGHYEGVDERVRETLIDREVSIGDYVLTGGELAAMVVVDAVARLVPGVLDAESISEESYDSGLLEYPHYTRPAVWEERPVPTVLLSGHHGQVALWRRQQRLRRTFERRPDLLAGAGLTAADRAYLRSLGWAPDGESG